MKNEAYLQKELVEIYHASAESIPIQKESLNVILAIQTHMYWNNIDIALEEIMRVLKKEGVFSIICEKDKIKYHLPIYLNNNKMHILLKDKGFKDIQIYETNQWIQFTCRK
ncbi:MAG: methyltransferase domain-containing protein [Coprobacillaceae bacterium]